MFLPPSTSNPLRSLARISIAHLHTAAQPATHPSAAAHPAAADLHLPPPSSSLDPTTVLETLSGYANDWRRALDFFHWAEQPPHRFTHTSATYARIVDILGKHLEFTVAWSLLLRSPSPHPTILRSLLNRLSAAHLVPDALSAFHRSPIPPSPSTFHLLLDALSDNRHVSDAEHLALHHPHPPFPPDTKTLNILLRGWLKLPHFAKCRQLWLDMDRRGIPKDLRSYTIYMDVLSKSGKPWKAVKLYQEMKQKRIPLDVVAYNTVIHAAGLSEGGVDQSIRFFRQMLDSGCRPSSATFNTIIKLLLKAGRVREGYTFLNRMKKEGCEPDVITYHCFFQYLTQPKEILHMFDRMRDNGCRPRLDTYTMLMKKFGRWGFLRPVLMVWGALEESGCSPDSFAYNALIDALLQKGMVEIARKYDQEMLAKGLSAKARKELGTNGEGDESGDDNALRGVF